MNMANKTYLTTKDLSEILKVKEKTIYNWAAVGAIPCRKINGVLRFSVDEVLEWVESCRKGPAGV